MAEPFIPDPLMRFSPTPFDWTVAHLGCTMRIESNDLEIALGLWQAWAGPRGERMVHRVHHVRLVVDRGTGYGGIGPAHDDEPVRLENGSVRTLLYGTGTVLFYDTERRELLGFLGPDVTANDLLERFVPSLMDCSPGWTESPQILR